MVSLVLLLAYAALAYLFASAGYLLLTATWGSPFMDKVRADPALLATYTESAAKRRKAFMGCLLGAAGVLVLWRPKLSCA